MNDITTNVAEAYRYNYDLTVREVGKTLRTGMRKALRNLVKDTKANLRASYRNVNKQNPRYNDTLISGVRASKVYTAKDGGVVGYVKISKRKKSGSGVYRLLFLEQGTDYRQLRRNSANRGKIEGKWFFRRAVDAGNNKFERDMIDATEAAITKINASK